MRQVNRLDVCYWCLVEVTLYRGGNKGLFVLLSRTQAGPGRTVKQEQEEISSNHVQTVINLSVLYEIVHQELAEQSQKVTEYVCHKIR